MIVLSLDSATEAATCAILKDNRLLGEITYNYKKQHSVILMPMIDSLLKNLQLTIENIDGFVVSKGPGSFTGLRIGAATIKGLSQGLDKPFVSVSSLDALAYNMTYTSGIICPIIDALRDNVYTALYSFKGDKLEKLTDYMLINISKLTELLKSYNSNVCFIGDCTDKFKDILNSSLSNISFAPKHLNFVRASSLGELGMELIKSGTVDDIYNFVPLYLMKSQAEREYDKKMELVKNE